MPDEGAGGQVRQGARKAAGNPWVDRGARIGLAARGVVFVVLGYLVARIALGALGGDGTQKAASGPGVADDIAAQPGGRAVLILLALGLELFAMFNVLDAALHHEAERSDAKRWAERLQPLWGALVYGGFGIYCIVIAATSPSRGGNASHGDQKQTQLSARILRWPAGPLWLGLIAAVLFGCAGYMLYKGISRKFLDEFKRSELTPRTRRLVVTLGVVGHVGRAAAFGLVGWFVAAAAVENDPQKGKGVDGSARMLANSPVGPYVLWVVAVMLAAFGLYLFGEARYRRI